MNQDFNKTLHHSFGQESLHKREAITLQQRERYKQLYSSYMKGCLELQLSSEVSNEIGKKRSFWQTAFFCGAPWQDLQLLQTIIPQGQPVIKVSKCKPEELARKWEMSSVDELLQADPHKDNVISLWYYKDFMFKLTKLAPKPSALQRSEGCPPTRVFTCHGSDSSNNAR